MLELSDPRRSARDRHGSIHGAAGASGDLAGGIAQGRVHMLELSDAREQGRTFARRYPADPFAIDAARLTESSKGESTCRPQTPISNPISTN